MSPTSTKSKKELEQILQNHSDPPLKKISCQMWIILKFQNEMH